MIKHNAPHGGVRAAGAPPGFMILLDFVSKAACAAALVMVIFATRWDKVHSYQLFM